MRRKAINITIDSLPEDVKTAIIEYIKSKIPNTDINTLKITGYEQYNPTFEVYAAFIENLKIYIHINGNRVVRKKELAHIGRISRPSLDRLIKHKLILSEFDRQQMNEDFAWKEYITDQTEENKSKYFAAKDSFSYVYIINKNRYWDKKYTFDLQKIVDFSNGFTL